MSGTFTDNKTHPFPIHISISDWSVYRVSRVSLIIWCSAPLSGARERFTFGSFLNKKGDIHISPFPPPYS